MKVVSPVKAGTFHLGFISAIADGRECFVAEPPMLWPPAHEAMRVPKRLAADTNCLLVSVQDASIAGNIRFLFIPQGNRNE